MKNDKVGWENPNLIPAKSKKVPTQEVEFSIPTLFVFRVITERQERTSFTDGISCTETAIFKPRNSLPFEKH